MFIMKLIVFGDKLICEDLAAHGKIVIKMTVIMKIMEIIFAESIL